MRPHSDVLDRIVYDLASAIDTPRALSVWLCWKHDHRALLELPGTDFASNDTLQVKLDYFISSYLTKYKGLDTKYNLRDVALEKWFASEVQCAVTNANFASQSFLRGLSPRVSALLFSAQRKIATILGTFDPRVTLTDCKWASGSTFDIKLSDAKPDIKMTRTFSVTSRALPHLKRVLEHDPHWFASLTGIMPSGAFCACPSLFNSVRGSRFLTVAKNAKTDRCIAAEPTGNSFLQQGLHSYMKRRLKRFGVDLGNQTRNQQGAQRAYAEGLATLDLSAASDTISRELVYHLLPIDWVFLMDDLRSPETRVNNAWIRTEKFVSMGNAFCFELETLIFYALARAVCGEDATVEVYGDDIIVPSQNYEELKTLLEICGFKLNMSKSYASGNFYESCGEHYHMGQSITPVYQKEPCTDLSERVRLHNRILRFGLTLPSDHRLWRKILKLSKWMISTHPATISPKIPYGTEGDDGYLVDPLRLLKAYDKNHGFKCHVLVWKPVVRRAFSESALLAYKLRRPKYQNVEQTGRCGSVTGGKWVLKTRWVPESGILLR